MAARLPGFMETMQEKKMKTRGLVPVVRELRFITLITLGILLASLAGSGILIVMFNHDLSSNFATAFFTMRSLYSEMNLLSLLAVILQFVFSATIVFLVAIRYSHKISGPMYRLRMILSDFQEGREINSVTFRTGDFLKPLEALMTRMFDRINHQKRLVKKTRELLADEPHGTPNRKEAILRELQNVADELENDNV